jgi:hypothetical protein
MFQGQSLDSLLILPFFLSLPPPGTALDLQLELLTQSLQHLYDLFSNDAEYASYLIRLLATSIRTGDRRRAVGGRVNHPRVGVVPSSGIGQSRTPELLNVSDFSS